MDICSKTIPKSSTNPNNKNKPWFNGDCDKAAKARKNALCKFTLEPTANNLQKYNEARQTVKQSKRFLEKLYLQNLIPEPP